MNDIDTVFLPRMTVQGGVYRSKKEIIEAVEDGGHKFSDWARELIMTGDWKLLTAPEEIDVYETTVKELTGKDVVTTTELYEIRDRLGFCDAPDETALLIRLATDQPMDGGWLYVLSQPKLDCCYDPIVLVLSRSSGGSRVTWDFANPKRRWRGDVRLLICRNRTLAT